MADKQRRAFLQLLFFLAATHVVGCGGGGSSGGGGPPPGGGGGGTTTVGAATRSQTSVGTNNNYPSFGGALFTSVGSLNGGLNYGPFQTPAADNASVSKGSTIVWSNVSGGGSQTYVA